MLVPNTSPSSVVSTLGRRSSAYWHSSAFFRSSASCRRLASKHLASILSRDLILSSAASRWTSDCHPSPAFIRASSTHLCSYPLSRLRFLPPPSLPLQGLFRHFLPGPHISLDYPPPIYLPLVPELEPWCLGLICKTGSSSLCPLQTESQSRNLVSVPFSLPWYIVPYPKNRHFLPRHHLYQTLEIVPISLELCYHYLQGFNLPPQSGRFQLKVGAPLLP